eukprot:TRINITY_DN8990_c0_g1_i1.p1 TRINITY_DN8990_c0_g1~~TRINITY_DN8990_c0_g1_i1.p1  ORF type:complete len:137 (+),score=9.29 TRINITY_DN8990_c0_g1_i1:2-412(+)
MATVQVKVTENLTKLAKQLHKRKDTRKHRSIIDNIFTEETIPFGDARTLHEHATELGLRPLPLYGLLQGSEIFESPWQAPAPHPDLLERRKRLQAFAQEQDYQRLVKVMEAKVSLNEPLILSNCIVPCPFCDSERL